MPAWLTARPTSAPSEATLTSHPDLSTASYPPTLVLFSLLPGAEIARFMSQHPHPCILTNRILIFPGVAVCPAEHISQLPCWQLWPKNCEQQLLGRTSSKAL